MPVEYNKYYLSMFDTTRNKTKIALTSVENYGIDVFNFKFRTQKKK